MAEFSAIEWTDHTFNPWIGCTKVGPGCDNCYAADLSRARLGVPWGPGQCGYTRIIDRAGRYDRAEAMRIAGTRDGGWHPRKGNPDEIAIPEHDAIEQYAAITASQVAALSNEVAA